MQREERYFVLLLGLDFSLVLSVCPCCRLLATAAASKLEGKTVEDSVALPSDPKEVEVVISHAVAGSIKSVDKV